MTFKSFERDERRKASYLSYILAVLVKQASIAKPLSRWRWTAQQRSLSSFCLHVLANPFARCGRSCVSYRWSDHERRRVKFIWFLFVFDLDLTECIDESPCGNAARSPTRMFALRDTSVRVNGIDSRGGAHVGGKVGCTLTLLESVLGDDLSLSLSVFVRLGHRGKVVCIIHFPLNSDRLMCDQWCQIMCATCSFHMHLGFKWNLEYDNGCFLRRFRLM